LPCHYYVQHTAFLSLREKATEAKSFHHGVVFVPPWGKFLSTMVERNLPHGGKEWAKQGKALTAGK
jgi:hypothetical protein